MTTAPYPPAATSGPAAGQLAAHLAGAVNAAAAHLPGAATLTPGAATGDVAAIVVPPQADTAVLAHVSGQVSGVVLVTVSTELVDALAHSPLGPLELAPAVQPALDAAGAALGHVTVEAGQTLPVDVALDALRGHTLIHAVPLSDGDRVTALVALGLTVPPPPAHRPTVRASGLELLRDVEMDVTVELGRTRMPVRDLLSLTPGAVVELDRKVGEAIDIYVNNRLVARGEVVLVEDKLGVTMTEIIKAERA
jgi:flagellar motor switch protein FliN/FliY